MSTENDAGTASKTANRRGLKASRWFEVFWEPTFPSTSPVIYGIARTR